MSVPRALFAQRDLRFWMLALTLAASGALLLMFVLATAAQYAGTQGYFMPSGGLIAGDYIAFRAAADAVWAGDAALIYQAEPFEARLQALAPRADGAYGLLWQYPPTMYLLVAPLAAAPYLGGYAAWTGGSAALYFAAMRRVGVSWFALFVVLSSPFTFHAVISGQNGFLSALFLLIAAYDPARRPILAGAAAALLTLKPQLGLLLPVVYIAGGHWRAFGVAAVGTLGLAVLSALAFGPSVWLAFLHGLGETSGHIDASRFPFEKMATPFAWLKYAGAPSEAALAVHGVFALAAMALVARVWAVSGDRALRAAALCTGVFFVSPYGYHYELIILAFPLAVIAERGVRGGFLRGEPALIAMAAILPLLIASSPKGEGFGWAFPAVLLGAVCVARRIAHHEPGVFRLSSLLSEFRQA